MAKRSRASSLFTRDGFEAFVAALPATEIVHQWGDASVAKLGGKIYAVFGGGVSGDATALSFKCSDMAFEMLPEVKGVRPAPYLARAKWVAVSADADLSADELAGYIAEAHRLVGSKLTAKVREGLGLPPKAKPRDRLSAHHPLD